MKDKILQLRSEGKSYKQIKIILNCSSGTIAYHCGDGQKEKANQRKRNKKLGIEGSEKVKVTKNCLWCSTEFTVKNNCKNQKCCSPSCSQHYINKTSYDETIKKWKSGEISGGRGEYNQYGSLSTHIRKYIFIKYNNKCSKCGWGELNLYTNTIPLEVDHIDGDSCNHKEHNLDLLCPNCHSLTKGHSTSKGNGRRYYRQKYHKEKVG